MFNYYNKKKHLSQTAQSLYGLIVAQTRKPVFYAEWGVPDNIEGRFEMLVIHMSLVVDRLKQDKEEGLELARLVSEAFIDDLDDSFREMGVGDLAVPKRMKKASEAYFGRLHAYSSGLEDKAENDLCDALGRNISADEEGGVVNVAAIADYMCRSSSGLEALEFEKIARGELAFAEPGNA